MSYRRLDALLRNSPPNSAYIRSVTGDGWTQTDHLLADLFDLLAAVNTGGKAKPHERPKTRRASANAIPMSEARKRFAYRRDN